ncbi:MAG: hypothetical protein AAF318_07755 [Pseudomonadota bacterium]
MDGEMEHRFWAEVARIGRCMLVSVDDGVILAVPARCTAAQAEGALHLELEQPLSSQELPSDVCVVYADAQLQISVQGHARHHADTVVVRPGEARVWAHSTDDIFSALGRLTGTRSPQADETAPLVVKF